MKKKWITIIVVLVLIALLVGVLVLLNQPPANDSSGSDASTSDSGTGLVYLVEKPEGVNLRNVTVDNDKGSFSLDTIKEGYVVTYTLIGFEDCVLNDTLTSQLNSMGGSLTHASFVTDNGNLADYGLDKPSSTSVFTYEDGSKQELRLGNLAPGESSYYYATVDDRNIYLVSASTVRGLTVSPFEMVDKTITGGTAEEAAFNYITLGGTVREEEIKIGPPPDVDDTVIYVSNQILEPVDVGTNGTTLNKLLSPVFGLVADEVIGIARSDSELAAFGLNEPYSTVYVDSPTVEEPFTLIASEPDSAGNVNLKTDAYPLIYKVQASALPWMEATVFELMDKLVHVPHIDSISTITITYGGEDHIINLTGEGDELVVKMDGKNIEDISNFRKFYQVLLSAAYEEIPEDLPDYDAGPILQIKYEYRDRSKADVVSFYDGPARRVFVQLNDESPFLAQSTYITKLQSDVDDILAGKAILSL